MKKTLLFCMLTSFAAQAVELPPVAVPRDPVGNAQNLFDANDVGTVAFMGGSITQMEGYRPLMIEWLKKRYPRAALKFVSAGISSTCSDTGAFRLEEDVFSGGAPDLLFLEFAVNDSGDGLAGAGLPPEEVSLRIRRSMEGIVRHARKLNPSIDIVIVLFVTERILNQVQKGETPPSYAAHMAVAEYYKLPTINIAAALARRIADGSWTWQRYRDCHPSPDGCKMVAEEIQAFLKEEWKEKQLQCFPHAIPDPMDPKAYADGHSFPFEKVSVGKGWQVSMPDWDKVPGPKRERYLVKPPLWSVTPGAETAFEFVGDAAGVFVTAGPDAGVLEVSVDGGAFKAFPLWRRWSERLNYPHTVVFADGLEWRKHAVKLRVGAEKGKGGGNAVRIHKLWVNGVDPNAPEGPGPEQVRAAEQMMLFDAAAAKRFLADMKDNAGYDYAKWAPKVEALISREDAVRAVLGGVALKRPGGRVDRPVCGSCGKVTLDEAVKLVSDYRDAMLANPILSFDRLLAIRRKVNDPREAHGGWGSGFLGINAHNHWDMWYKGIKNDIVAISDWKSPKPKIESLYEPKVASIVKDIDLDFDASRIMFTGWRGTNRLYGVYEIPAAGSDRPVSVSPEEHKDIMWWDGTYLPNRDQVIFLGTAAYQFLPCEDGNIPMAVIYRKDRKTGEIRQLTYEQDSDYMPSITHDGRILYTRWEYSDIPHYFSRILFTMNPDGIGQLALWGSGSMMPTFFGHARCIPGDPHRITFYGGGHHEDGEVGRMFIIDPTLARAYPFRYDPPDREWGPIKHVLRIPAENHPKEETGVVHEFPGWGKEVEGDVCDPYSKNQFARGRPYFAYPYPLDGKYHLATLKAHARGLMGVYLVDVFDNMTLIAEIEDGLLCEAMPFAPRRRPPVIPDRSVPGAKTCTVHVADIYNGQGLRGVPRGTVKKVRVFSYHYNYHNTGGHSRLGLDRVEAGWDIKRILGTVDVEEDGSFCFEMPANTPVSLQPLDASGAAVQLMRSWVVGMPGERVSCTGCHEDNRSSVQTKRTIADEKYFRGEMQQIRPEDGDGIRPWGFAAEAWPVVQKYCLSCHGDPAKAPVAKADQGGFDPKTGGLSGKRIVMDSAESAFRALHPYCRRPGPETESTVLTPLDWHVSTSPLVQILQKGHHGVKVSPQDMKVFYTWIDLNLPFYGKWDPKPFKTDAYQVGCDDPVRRRKDLLKQYAHTEDDPEGEYDKHLALVKSRKVEPVPPVKTERPKGAGPEDLKKIGWPLKPSDAYDLCAGGQDDLAPVMLKVVDIGNGQSITFRRMPAGSYPMGSACGYPDEAPVRIVTIDKPFWISETEIRNDQYNVFDPKHDSLYQKAFGKDHVYPGWIGNHRLMPVVRVSWNEAQAFCRWLSGKTGLKASLPTEEQWEWAARAGTMTPFPWGGLDDDFSKWANLADKDVRNANTGFQGPGAVQSRMPLEISQNFPLHDERWEDDWFTINYVRRARPNAWGMYDMHGNASEWTASDYGDGRKTVRGGSFASRPRDATSSWRWGYMPWQKVFDVGFRVILADAE